MKKAILNFLKFLAFLSVGLVILYFVYQHQNESYQAKCALDGISAESCSLLDKVIEDFASTNYFWLLMVLFCYVISNISRAIRWNMLLEPLSHKPGLLNSFLITILGYFANLGLPRVGEVVKPVTMAKYEKIPLEKVMGTIVVDRAIDVLSILFLSGLVFLLEFDKLWAFFSENEDVQSMITKYQSLLIWLMLGGLVALLLLFVYRKKWQQWQAYKKIEGIVMGFVEGVKSVSKLDRPWWFVFHSINIWFMYFLMTYFCFFAFLPTAHLSLVAGLVVFVFGGWGIVIPAPGGMGSYHFLALTALTFYGVDSSDGFSWANISFFTIQLGCNVSVGLLALLLLPIINREPNAVAEVDQVE